MHPALQQLLIGLGQLGKRAAAAAVDTALEEAEVVVKDVQTRIKAGRSQAQTIGKRPPKYVKVDVVGSTVEVDEPADNENEGD